MSKKKKRKKRNIYKKRVIKKTKKNKNIERKGVIQEETGIIVFVKDMPMEEHEKCNDPPCRYDITTLNREKFQIFLNENSVNLLMKNESKFFFRYTFTKQRTIT